MEDKAEVIPFKIPGEYWLNGIPYPGDFPEDTIKKIREIAVYPDDVYVIGYPKSGSTWTLVTIEAILRAEQLEDMVQTGVKAHRLPLEFPAGLDSHVAEKRPRISHCHVRYDQLPIEKIKQQNAKIVHIVRNPKDVAVSYYHFVKIAVVFGLFSGTFDTFFDAYMDGGVPWGAWYEHTKNWSQYRDQENILFIDYETFKNSPEEVVRKLASFLGKLLDDDVIRRIADVTSMKSMKSNAGFHLNYGLKGDFLRKGVVGDWVNYFTPEQEERIDEMYNTFVSETGWKVNFS